MLNILMYKLAGLYIFTRIYCIFVKLFMIASKQVIFFKKYFIFARFKGFSIVNGCKASIYITCISLRSVFNF